MQEYEMVRKTVAMDEELVNELDHFAKRERRDFSGALRYALRIGLLSLENPELTVEEIKDIIEARVDEEMGKVAAFNPQDV
jgi:metal-responsive CopG/Arc/MetJ family transcriptional regulator